MNQNKRILEIIQRTANAFGLTSRAILKRTKRPAIAIPRMVAMTFCVEDGYSLTEVARHFGKRGHQTVAYAHKAITDYAETNNKFLNKITPIWEDIEKS
jgi:chromosomal replication initiation ATPase DnaA